MLVKMWHNLTFTEVARILRTNLKTGLAVKEVVKRQKKYGLNKLPTKAKFSAGKLFLMQFHNILIYILCFAAAISFVLKDFVDAYIILAAILVNVAVGFVQEYKAQTALDKLQEAVSPLCIVLRDGHREQILTQNIVSGDLVLLKAGDKVPADGRLVAVKNFQVNEANLTGESVPIDKETKTLKTNIILAARLNMVYMGTTITKGAATMLVTDIGQATELGKIALLVKKSPKKKTPLQERLDIFSKKLGGFIVLVCTGLFLWGISLGKPILEMFILAVAVAVSSIPEGLLVGVTAILAVGMQRILKQNGLVRKLTAAEVLGSTDVICSDKTGTLTEGEMKTEEIATLNAVQKIEKVSFIDNKVNSEVLKVLEIGMLCNDAAVQNQEESIEKWKLLGAPTEKAMLLAAIESGLKKDILEKKYPLLDEEPFDSTRKYNLSLRQEEKNKVVFYNGAPEKILGMATKVFSMGRAIKLTAAARNKILNIHHKYTEKGFRLLGVGYKEVMTEAKTLGDIKDLDKEVVFVGFFVIADPVRPEVKASILQAQAAGIKTIMITGDHKNTALHIAQELGLANSAGKVLDGDSLAALSETDFRQQVESVNVYARVSPYDKLRIVKALRDKGHVVAMTGDGINDAPALKAADIGIAVGAGTDVTKETADMVLLDNNFKTIVAAVLEGRIIMDNIKKVIVFLLSNSFTEMVLISGSFLLAMPLPLTAAQILWINLVTDSFPYMALTLEKGEPDIMLYPPRRKKEPILDKEMKTLIFIIGIITDIILLGLYLTYYKIFADLPLARTLVFTCMNINSLLYVFSCKSLRTPLWKMNLLDNKYLLAGVGIGFALVFISLYSPFLKNMFGFSSLRVIDWYLIFLLAFVNLSSIELGKYFFYKTMKIK